MSLSSEGLEGRFRVALRGSIVLHERSRALLLKVQVWIRITLHFLVAFKQIMQRYDIERHLQQTNEEDNSSPAVQPLVFSHISPDCDYAAEGVGQGEEDEADAHTPVLGAEHQDQHQTGDQVHDSLPYVCYDHNAGQELHVQYQLEEDQHLYDTKQLD